MLHIVNASVPIIIEIKGNYSPYIENRIYEIIRSYTGKVAIKSFNIAYIQWICEFLPFLTKGLIVDRNNNNNLKSKQKCLVRFSHSAHFCILFCY